LLTIKPEQEQMNRFLSPGKPIFLIVLLIFMFTNVSFYIGASEIDESATKEPLIVNDNFDLDSVINNDTVSDFLDKNDFCVSSNYDPRAIMPILIEQLKILPIMQENFYCRTYALNKRLILDQPAFFPYRDYPFNHTFGMHFFYNETERMNFTTHSSNISSYVAIANENLLSKIADSLALIKITVHDFNLDPMTVFPLFGCATVQDRKVGIMFHGDKWYRNRQYHFHVRAPIMYEERNFFISEEDQQKIQEVLGQSAGADDTTMDFAKKHLISDKLGISDTRVNFDWIIHKHPGMALEVGIQVTLPTAFAFEKGIYGSSFEDRPPACNLDIGALWDLAQNGRVAAATKIGTDFLESTLDRLALILLDTGLGYDRHLGLGLALQTRSRLAYWISKSWARAVKFKTRFSADYYFPAGEDRFFIELPNPSQFNPAFFPIDELDSNWQFAQSRLDFLSIKFIEKLNPFKVRATVHPGAVIQWTSSIIYETGRWCLSYLSDTWIRTPERIGFIRRSCTIPKDLDIRRGTRHYGYQSKLGLGILYTSPGRHHSTTASLYGDYTYWNEGIGHDYTIALNVEVHF